MKIRNKVFVGKSYGKRSLAKSGSKINMILKIKEM